MLFFFCNFAFADFKEIKKKAKINNPEIIFPIPKNLDKCQTKLYVSPELNIVKPLLKVKAPRGYGLDDRYNYALDRFTNFSFPCSGGNIEACEHVKNTILNWAKVNAAKRTGPSDGEGRHWNDTLTINLYIASPMLAAYSFAKQVINVPEEEDKIIKKWFKKIVKKNQHLMYDKTSLLRYAGDSKFTFIKGDVRDKKILSKLLEIISGSDKNPSRSLVRSKYSVSITSLSIASAAISRLSEFS